MQNIRQLNENNTYPIFKNSSIYETHKLNSFPVPRRDISIKIYTIICKPKLVYKLLVHIDYHVLYHFSINWVLLLDHSTPAYLLERCILLTKQLKMTSIWVHSLQDPLRPGHTFQFPFLDLCPIHRVITSFLLQFNKTLDVTFQFN